MNAHAMPLLVFAGALATGGCGALVYLTFFTHKSRIDGLLGRYARSLGRQTSFLLCRYGAWQIIRAQLGALLVALGLLAVTRQAMFLAFALAVAVGPPVLLRKRRAARIALLERQLDSWLLMLANALKATPSVGDAIASTVSLVPKPFGEELDLLIKEVQLGTPLDRALDALSLRINSEVISSAIATLLVARQTGGDLPGTLERAAAALRESARLEGVLRTKTAEGRGQVLVLASIPFLLCFIIAWLDPSWFDPMLDSDVGKTSLGACAVTWSLAALWAHQIAGAEL